MAVVGAGDHRVPVTAGGTILRGATAPDDLPLIDDSRSERILALLGAAPKPLLRRAERAFAGPRGLTVRMADGPEVYFGPPTELAAKWAAAARVLADPAAEGAEYVDVRVPQRSAAGGLAPIEDDDEETEDALAPGATTGTPAPGAEVPADPAAATPDPASGRPAGNAHNAHSCAGNDPVSLPSTSTRG